VTAIAPRFALGAVLSLAFAAALPAQGAGGRLGRIDFATSGTPAAQEQFVRGALLLHSFEFDDAAERFREAEKREPGFAMAYWGEAMTFNHPLWAEQDREAALAALARLAPTRQERLAKAPTPREKMYLEAVETLYGEGDKPARDRAYAESMRRLHEAFPEDLDAASFYALALLGACEGKRDFATYMRAAAAVEDVFAKNPEHPGAVHYLIHCYDDPIHAPLGMRAARVYATIAPAATHALHMPSHIFLASGMWPEVASSNEASWQASVDRAGRLKLSAEAHSFHALSWLEYAYLQQGRYADARRSLATMEEDAAKTSADRARHALVAMRAAYLVETGLWTGDVARRSMAGGDRSMGGLQDFIDGVAALEAGDRKAAEAALARLGARKGETGEGYMSGGGGNDAILGQELEAKILLARGDRDRALALMAKAAAAEDAMSYDFGPPEIVKPTHELYGEMLLDAGRAAEARREFEASLARAPRRALSLLGLARAAAKQGDLQAARDAFRDLSNVWSRADPGVPGLEEVRRGAENRS